MTNKYQAIASGVIAAVMSFISWFLMLPPSQQGDVIAPLIALVPVTWQSSIAVAMKAVGAVTGLYATFKAAQSGPQSPPKNPSNE